MDFEWTEEEIAMAEGFTRTLSPQLGELETRLNSSEVKLAREGVLRGFGLISESPYCSLILRERQGPTSLLFRERLSYLSPRLYFALEMGNLLFLKIVEPLAQFFKADYYDTLKNLRSVASVLVLEAEGVGPISFVPNGAYADLFLLIAPNQKGYKASVFDQLEIGASTESTPMDWPFGPIFSHMRPKELPYRLDHGVSLELGTLRKIQDQILIGASLGSIKRAFEEARDFTKAKRRGDRPLIACQEVGFKLAEIFTLLDASRHLALRAFWAEEIAHREKDVLLFCAKAFCAESSERVLSEAIQIMGKDGFEGSLKELYLFSKLFGVLGTPTERARVNIGGLLLGA